MRKLAIISKPKQPKNKSTKEPKDQTPKEPKPTEIKARVYDNGKNETTFSARKNDATTSGSSTKKVKVPQIANLPQNNLPVADTAPPTKYDPDADFLVKPQRENVDATNDLLGFDTTTPHQADRSLKFSTPPCIETRVPCDREPPPVTNHKATTHPVVAKVEAKEPKDSSIKENIRIKDGAPASSQKLGSAQKPTSADNNYTVPPRVISFNNTEELSGKNLIVDERCSSELLRDHTLLLVNQVNQVNEEEQRVVGQNLNKEESSSSGIGGAGTQIRANDDDLRKDMGSPAPHTDSDNNETRRRKPMSESRSARKRRKQRRRRSRGGENVSDDSSVDAEEEERRQKQRQARRAAEAAKYFLFIVNLFQK